MTGRPRSARTAVYPLLDAEQDVHAIVRYSGDPDEFTALAHAWLLRESGSFVFFDAPIAVEPPVLRWFRMNPYNGDDYGWTLGTPTGPGRGNWRGSYLKVTTVGCSQCQRLHGAHDPAGCLNANVVALNTCQISVPGMRRSNEMIHLVRVRGRTPGRLGGTPGPTLCDLDRFGPGVGFNMGGGHVVTGRTARSCYMCEKVARRDFPGVPVTTGMREFAQAFLDTGLPVAASWAAMLTPTPGSRAAMAPQLV